MTNPVSILPANATPWDGPHELTDAARCAALDPSIITKVKDALLCEPQFLALLGWERSVDLWFDDWSEQKRRHVVDKWFEFERLKGTPEGFRRFYRLAGARLVKATLPPQGIYARGGMTEEQRAAYLAQFQQIRISPKVPVREFQRGFYPSRRPRSSAFVGHTAPTQYRVTIDTVVREARLYDSDTNEEKVLTRREITRVEIERGTAYDFEDIVIPARRIGFYVGQYLDGRRFLNRDDAPERTIRTTIERPYGVALSHPQWSSVIPSARLISIRPDLVRSRWQEPVRRSSFLGRTSTGLRSAIFCGRDTAWQHVYERFHLYDSERDRGVTAGEPGWYVGRSRLGMVPYTAEMKVEIRGRSRPWEFAQFVGGYVTAERRTPLDRALEATRAVKAARDTIFLDTVTRRRRRIGDTFTIGGGVMLGALVEA